MGYDGRNSPFLQPDAATNPDFYGANRVFIPYCTGDLHTGTQTSTSEKTYGLWFSGSVNLRLIIDHLKQSEGLNDAKYVMLTGESAGGMGTYFQVDKVASYFG